MLRYRIGGLSVSSEFELPSAIPFAESDAPPDVTVRFGAVPTKLDQATLSGPNWDLHDETFLLRVPRLARFLITAGREIAVEREPDISSDDAASFVLGTSFGILLHQRGAMVLHGSAVASNGSAVAICGHSGAGKSTLAAALCRDGCEFVADDICVVGLDSERRPIVLPDGRQLKLWSQAIERLDLVARKGAAVRYAFEKYFVEPEAVAAVAPQLSAIYVLREQRGPMPAGIEPLSLADAMRMLDLQAYRPGVRARMGSKPAMLAQGAAVLAHAKAYMFTRPRGFEHMDEATKTLRAHWSALQQ